jgi:CubicO group peptidase (beta-lactamase class C family)
VTSATSSFYDLASLAKPLITAPLAHAFLELDADRRFALGFHDRDAPLTARQLLCHSAGLPPWRPYPATGHRPPATVAEMLRREAPSQAHPLLRDARPGETVYSDLGYRLLAELVEAETRVPFAQLGAALSGLSPAPWREAPIQVPDGPDAEAWRAAEPELALPPSHAHGPHDLNARAGMTGHAGFGATAAQVRNWLRVWSAQWAPRMCVEASRESDGSVWGLGLRAAHRGAGRFAELLVRVPMGAGVHVLEAASTERVEPAPDLASEPGPASAWWCHFGFTGPALFFRPEDGACLALLLNRRGPQGGLLDAEALRARRWKHLAAFTAKLGR